MTSTRLILVFLGLIFLIIIALSGRRIAANLKNSLAGLNIPGFKGAQITVTPAPSDEGETKGSVVATMTPGAPTESGEKKQSTANAEIPATGPSEVVYLIISGGLIGGTILRLTAKNLRSRL